jgi:RNA polymerase sigma-70 factor (ECF subfamily)
VRQRTGDWSAAPPDPNDDVRRDTFEVFYAAELPRLVALARTLCPAGLAEDVAQEAMLATYRRWREVRDLERPDLWVRRVCMNLAVSQFRRRVVELRTSARLAGRRQPHLELSDETEEFWAAVRLLPHRQAQAAALRFVYDMPIHDIAETLGCSDGTVKQHLSRARHALSESLGVALEVET